MYVRRALQGPERVTTPFCVTTIVTRARMGSVVDAPGASRRPIPSLPPRPVAQQPGSAPQPSAPQPVARTTANRSRSRTAAPQPSAQQPAAQPHVLPRPPRTTFQSSCDLVNHHKHRRSRRSDIMLTLARRTLSPYLGLRRRGGVGPGGFTLVPPPETSDIREVTAVTCGITALAFPIRYGWVS